MLQLFLNHLYLTTIAVIFMMSFLLQEYQFCKTSLNVQKQAFPVVLHKAILRNFTKFTAKHLCHTVLFDEVTSHRPAT